MQPGTDAPAPPARRAGYTRELTALVGVPIAVWVVGWAPLMVFNTVIALIATLALYEFLGLGQRKGFHLPMALCILVMLFIIAAFVLEPISVEMGVFLALLVIPAAYVLTPGDIGDALPSSAIAVLATLYVGMLGGSLIRLRNDFDTGQGSGLPIGAKLVYFLLLVVWCGDAAAYYVGKKFGKTKLSPRISPKKTIEGLAGGIAASIVVGLTVRFTFFKEFPLLHIVIASVLLSVTGVIGDLAESMWKRSAAVKDSGTLIPGHGGFLDRFDSIFYTTPILYVYWFLIAHHFQTFRIMSA